MINPNTFSSQDYTLPQWSGLPQYKCFLQMIKDGCFIQNIPIKNKQFSLIGRLQDLSDICINNPTVSRKHAILQFKQNDDSPYLYDLGCTHGTQVNRQKLPVRAYHKISPFDTIKFGVSSRVYIYRCPELQQKLEQSNEEPSKQFTDILAENKKKLSKQQLKQKYLQMLQNDPYYAANTQGHSGTFSGQKKGAQVMNGVDWGISDEYQVYAYKNQNQFQIQPDVIRRLPGIDQMQLNKLSQYEDSLRRYQETERQLNQLSNKQKKQYGLQEKLRDKKQKLQKRFVEGLEALEKNQQWIRSNIFGQQSKRQNKTLRQKQVDTFEDDQFMDRTIAQKKNQKQENSKRENKQLFTTKDYWQLDKQMRSLLKQLIQLQNAENDSSNLLSKDNSGQFEQQVQKDDLDEFMVANNEDLAREDQQKASNRRQQICSKLQQIKKQLGSSIGEREVKKIQEQERGTKKKRQQSEQQLVVRRQAQKYNRIEKVMGDLQRIQEQEQQIDEEDLKVFDIYRQQAQEEEKMNNADMMNRVDGKRGRDSSSEQQLKKYENNIAKYPQLKAQRDIAQQQEYVDLTKTYH